MSTHGYPMRQLSLFFPSRPPWPPGASGVVFSMDRAFATGCLGWPSPWAPSAGLGLQPSAHPVNSYVGKRPCSSIHTSSVVAFELLCWARVAGTEALGIKKLKIMPIRPFVEKRCQSPPRMGQSLEEKMDSVCSLTSWANRHVGMENRSWVDGEPRQAAFGWGEEVQSGCLSREGGRADEAWPLVSGPCPASPQWQVLTVKVPHESFLCEGERAW